LPALRRVTPARAREGPAESEERKRKKASCGFGTSDFGAWSRGEIDIQFFIDFFGKVFDIDIDVLQKQFDGAFELPSPRNAPKRT
jgi:hypothetical protein